MFNSLKIIDKKSEAVEQNLHVSQKNEDFVEFLELEKSLVYFTTSLRSNEIVLEKMLKIEQIKKYPEDEDLLEDVIIENKQALEMAEIYTNILMSMMDSFSSIISNRLSQIMKFLTSVTIILAIPTLIYSLWGINVPVPFEESPFGFVGVILIGILLTLVVTFILWRKDML